MDSISSGHGPIVGSFEHCNGPSRPIEDGRYQKWMNIGEDPLVLI
jgi:hypothetical protein